MKKHPSAVVNPANQKGSPPTGGDPSPPRRGLGSEIDWSCTSGLSTGTISEKTIFNLSDNPLFKLALSATIFF